MGHYLKRKIKNAVRKSSILSCLPVKIFLKGSCVNNTNIINSDVDVGVLMQSIIKSNDKSLCKLKDQGVTETKFKSFLRSALEKEFGTKMIDYSGNKVFKIVKFEGCIDVDIIPYVTYINHLNNLYKTKIYGMQIVVNKSHRKIFINYPFQHTKNGKLKNKATRYRYKRVIRVLKNIGKYLIAVTGDYYHSFMIECIAYNIPNQIYLSTDKLDELVKNGCSHLLSCLNEKKSIKFYPQWTEVNDIKHIFDKNQLWKRSDVKRFLINVIKLMNNQIPLSSNI